MSLAHFANHFSKFINDPLIDNSNLLDFVSRSPMFAELDQSKALGAFARLKEHIIGADNMSLPWNGFGQCRFVENIVVAKDRCKNQVVGCIWPTIDKLEANISSFRLER